MPTPNKDNVEEMMREFAKSLSEKDVEFLVEMAQESDEKEIAEELVANDEGSESNLG